LPTPGKNPAGTHGPERLRLSVGLAADRDLVDSQPAITFCQGLTQPTAGFVINVTRGLTAYEI